MRSIPTLLIGAVLAMAAASTFTWAQAAPAVDSAPAAAAPGAAAPGGRAGGFGRAGGRGGAALGEVAPIPPEVKQTNPPRTPNPLTTYTPSGVRSAAPTNAHAKFVDIAKQGDPVDILFDGDSITDWWQAPPPAPASAPASAPATAPAAAASGAAGPGGRRGGGGGGFGQGAGRQGGGAAALKKHFGDLKIVNFAIAGDTTQGVLWGLKNGEGRNAEGEPVKMQPKAIMLMIGTNNAGGNTTGAEIAEGIGADVAELRRDFPNAKILLLAIFPRGTGPTDGARIKNEEANKIIARLDDKQHVFFLNINDKFLTPEGKLIGFRTTDNLHPTPEGYEIWANAVESTLRGLIK